MNETLRTIDRRASLRRYAETPITEEHRNWIVESALRAPTAGNMMLYSILEVDDPEKRKALSVTCGHSFVAEAPLVLLFLADMQRWVDFFERNDVPKSCLNWEAEYRTPGSAKLLLACCDALTAAQTSVIAAESLGIGSCYVGDILGHAEEHRLLFGLPPYVFPIALLCYGYPPEGRTPARSERFAREFIVHRDTYRRFSREELEAMVSDVAPRFAGLLKEKGLTFAELTYRGFMASAAVAEQERSVQVLLEPWEAGRADRLQG